MSPRAIVLALTPALLAGCGHESGSPEEDREEGRREAVPVAAAPARPASFERRVKAIGSVRAVPGGLARISAGIEGVVASIVVIEGARVEAGSPLVRLDDRPVRLDLEEKKAALGEAEASLALLKALPREPERRAAELEIEKARIAVDLARQALERLAPLHERKEVSDPQIFEARQALAGAENALKGAEARRDLLLQGPRPEAIAEGEAKVSRARASAASAAEKVDRAVLAAPIAGVVERILCHPGEFLAAGAVAIEVLDPSRVLVVAEVTPAEAAEIREGQPAWIAAAGGRTAAKVAFVGAAAAAATGLVPVTIAVDGPGLRPGMAARAEILVARHDGGLGVPEAAVVPSDEGPSIAVVREEKGARKAAILHPKVGLRDPSAGLIEVEAEGLSSGDLVIVSGAYGLPDGQPLVVEESPAGKEGKP